MPSLPQIPQPADPEEKASESRWIKYRNDLRDFWKEEEIRRKRSSLEKALRTANGEPKDAVILQLELLDWIQNLPSQKLSELERKQRTSAERLRLAVSRLSNLRSA